jgi:hypothetical protein
MSFFTMQFRTVMWLRFGQAAAMPRNSLPLIPTHMATPMAKSSIISIGTMLSGYGKDPATLVYPVPALA